jgi:hypothetical protein
MTAFWKPPLLAATFAAAILPRAEAFPLGLGPADWQVEWNGYGQVQLDPAAGILLSPLASTHAGETHSALVVARSTQLDPLRDFRIQLVVATQRQLRTSGPPNPWEVFWLFFNRHTPDGQNSPSSNYVIFKPNGVELGRAFGWVGQAFLATNTAFHTSVGQPVRIELTKLGNRIDASVNGVTALSYVGAGLYDTAGSIGLYSEDARVRIYSVNIEKLDVPPGG